MCDVDVYEEDSQSGKYLTFTLEKELFAIEIRNVVEIIGIQTITGVPEVPDYMKGIINLRGKIIPVIEVRLRFKKPSVSYDDRTCIIVIKIDEELVGLIVDNVDEVITIPDELISPPPNRAGFESRYIKGIGRFGNEVQLLLDCGKLFNSDEMRYMESNLEDK